MTNDIMENRLLNQSYYPIDYRQKDVREVIERLLTFQPLTIIGLPRVGLTRILRFILVNPKLLNDNSYQCLLAEIDLNDLFELKEINFWQLILKRIADKVKDKTVNQLYLSAAKSNDAFTFFDNTKQATQILCQQGFSIFLLFNRFDRGLPLFTYLFFSHLQSLKDVAKIKINFLFTSNRPLESLSPNLFKGGNLEVFSQKYYIKPASFKDLLPVIHEFEKSRKITLRKEIKKLVSQYSGGHAQYALLILQTMEKNNFNLDNIDAALKNDMVIFQQGKEIWDYLNIEEKSLLISRRKINSDHFLHQIGLTNPEEQICNPLLEYFIKTQGIVDSHSELTKKEKALLAILTGQKGQLVSRDEIINFVWPNDSEEVNNWTLDQLIKRLRIKIKQQKSYLEIMTVKNQGYKLI